MTKTNESRVHETRVSLTLQSSTAVYYTPTMIRVTTLTDSTKFPNIYRTFSDISRSNKCELFAITHCHQVAPEVT